MWFNRYSKDTYHYPKHQVIYYWQFSGNPSWIITCKQWCFGNFLIVSEKSLNAYQKNNLSNMIGKKYLFLVKNPGQSLYFFPREVWFILIRHTLYFQNLYKRKTNDSFIQIISDLYPRIIGRNNLKGWAKVRPPLGRFWLNG